MIWKIEQSYPEWWRNASAVWTPTFESFMDFWRNCGEIWGLFEDEKLLACLYVEFITPSETNVHVSVLEKIEPVQLVRFFKSLLKHKQAEGVRVVNGWIAKQNRKLLQIGAEAGFQPTGLKMSYGACKGKVITWIQVRN